MEIDAAKSMKQRNSKKSQSELEFWGAEAMRYQEWFCGTIPFLYKTPSPYPTPHNAFGYDAQAPMRAWNTFHQVPKYLADLALEPGSLRGKIVLDLGSGPFPSASGFEASTLLCLDALLQQYREYGYPSDWGARVQFIAAMTEAIPLSSHTVDAVISVNALDHVDDIQQTAREIRRVLRPDGLLRLHLHYHAPTTCEPIAFTDEMVEALFSWVRNFHPCAVSRQNFSTDLPEGEIFKLWSNF
jgi:ubiquinone/menaquinone biosynthesis C-methylase UbiE